MKLIHQSFLNYLDGKRLRDWKVKMDGETLLLSFNNRLLTLAKDVHGEDILDMSSIDPLQLLQNRIQTEVHTSENVVEYWEKGKESRYLRLCSSSHGLCSCLLSSFTHISSQSIRPGHLVEVQASFEAIKLKSDEYVLLAKLRSICILDRVVEHVSNVHDLYNPPAHAHHCTKDYNQAIIKTIRSKPISPLKKVKRRIGYQNGTGDSEVTESEQRCVRFDPKGLLVNGAIPMSRALTGLVSGEVDPAEQHILALRQSLPPTQPRLDFA
jgi:hypothetical protein